MMFVKCKNMTTGIHVEIERSHQWGWGRLTNDERAASLERWSADLRDFFRDHRSMDVNTIVVVPETEDQCSGCGRGWEMWDDEGILRCAHCGEQVAESECLIHAAVLEAWGIGP